MTLPEAKFPPAGPRKLEYTRTISYIFENPNWLMNALWSFLCQLVGQVIPILPQMVFTGYQFEVLDGLLANRGTQYPDFNINRLGEYLGRGVWPVLAALIVALVWTPVFIVYVLIAIGCVAALAAAGGEDAGPLLAVFGGLVAVMLGLLLVVVFLILLTPVMLRAGVAQDFMAAFDFGWISDFLKKMCVDVLLSMLFIIASALGIVLLTCGLGSLIVGPLLPFVQSHFWYQLYSLYLDRGGIPIPAKMMAAPQSAFPPA